MWCVLCSVEFVHLEAADLDHRLQKGINVFTSGMNSIDGKSINNGMDYLEVFLGVWDPHDFILRVCSRQNTNEHLSQSLNSIEQTSSVAQVSLAWKREALVVNLSFCL